MRKAAGLHQGILDALDAWVNEGLLAPVASLEEPAILGLSLMN
jgi:hypothetical protein